MTRYERAAWIMLITSIPAYIVYAVIVFRGAGDGALPDAPYVWPALITIGATVLANIVLGILAAVIWNKDGDLVDERDRQIERLGDQVGNSFLVIGGLAAMLMAMVEWDWFWIANVLFLSFFVAGVVSAAAKVATYRWGRLS